MTKKTADHQVMEQQTRMISAAVSQAAFAAREALGEFEPQIRALAIRQLALDVEIFAAAATMITRSITAESAAAKPPTGLYTMDEVAERLQVSRDCVAKWLAKPDGLKKTKAGRRTLITEVDLQDFLKRSTAIARNIRSTAA